MSSEVLDSPILGAGRVTVFLWGIQSPLSSLERLDENLQRACLEALECSREECRAFALRMTWEASARTFLGHVKDAMKIAHGSTARPAVAAA